MFKVRRNDSLVDRFDRRGTRGGKALALLRGLHGKGASAITSMVYAVLARIGRARRSSGLAFAEGE